MAEDITRRTAITIVAGAAAVSIIGLAAATPTIDPIFAAIDSYKEAHKAFLTTYRRVKHLPHDPHWAPFQGTLRAVAVSGRALIDTEPTTMAGVQALEKFLRHPSQPGHAGIRQRSWMAGLIQYDVEFEGKVRTMQGPGGIDYLIAKHTARLAAA